jgi:hypothetical protein
MKIVVLTALINRHQFSKFVIFTDMLYPYVASFRHGIANSSSRLQYLNRENIALFERLMKLRQNNFQLCVV